MHQQPGDRSCTTQAIGGNHFGPITVYMSKVDDATTADGSSAWFKVDEFGYDADNKTWGTDMLNNNCGKRAFTLPNKIPSGAYLVRAEAIALHTASTQGGAQFYMSCYVSSRPCATWLRCLGRTDESSSKSTLLHLAASSRKGSSFPARTRPLIPVF
jgi:hypothetical protein